MIAAPRSLPHDSGPQRGVLIPSYNSGPLLESTVRRVLAFWRPVVVVVDGSNDHSEGPVVELARSEAGLQVIRLPANTGKGGAVLAGLERAADLGWTHAAVIDADGQHQAADLPRFMEVSSRHPEAMILGTPVFGDDAPAVRVHGRILGNWWTNLETWWGGIGDSLFGFRVYPVAPALEVLRGMRGGRGFDFDTQIAVRLYWRGIPPVNLPTPVHYHPAGAGGVSHFRYLRDNLLLVSVHARLVLRSLTLLPRLWRYRQRPRLLDGPGPMPYKRMGTNQHPA